MSAPTDQGGTQYTVHLEVRAEHVSGAEPSWESVANELAEVVRQHRMTFSVREPHGRTRLGTVKVRSAVVDTASDDEQRP